MIGWFGADDWAGKVGIEAPARPVPIGATCTFCSEPITAGCRGVLFGPEPSAQTSHAECLFRSLYGGANHIRRLCGCFGGVLPPDPPGLSLHEAAILAFECYGVRGSA